MAKNTGTSKVVIHFDLDVIDPEEMVATVGTDPDGMKTDEVVKVINVFVKQEQKQSLLWLCRAQKTTNVIERYIKPI
ncbi:Arginase family protein [Porphyromonadaceae bacterium KH3R12]|jgi:arginase family enzyme|nr:Arginase family protein [Porphyromonadaceae bacterium KH3R12]